MFAKNSKAYSVYLLFRFVCSLAVSMSTVLSIVYHLEVVQLDAFQLVLVGTVLETSCFLFEIPTGVVADLYSRRRSVLIGMFLYGLGFLMEGALPWFAPVLLAQVVWGCGDTFITGALEAWIASEEEDKPIDKVFLRGSQMGQIGGVLGVVLGTLLGNINLQMPVILGGSLCLLLGLVLVRIMPETNFSPAIEERQGLLKDFVCLFKLNLGFVKGAPVLLALLAITLCGGLASEGFDRLSTAHFLDDTVIPVIGPLNSVTWFGVISLIGSGLGILASQLLIARMEKKGTVSRTSVVMSTSAGYILCLVLFAVGRSFWFMLLVFLLAGLMRTIKEPVLAAWMNDHVDEKMRATVFSTSGQLDSFGQIIGGPIVGLVAQQVSIPWGLVCTAFLLLPALFLVPVAGKWSYVKKKYKLNVTNFLCSERSLTCYFYCILLDVFKILFLIFIWRQISTMTVNAHGIVKCFDVFKNQFMCMCIIKDFKPVDPFSLQKCMERFYTGVIPWICFL